ncbi:MAG: hypothetical protein ACLRQO_07610 [Streptococcus salivarius]|nr:hypothetical protein [Streptococcus salivarius]
MKKLIKNLDPEIVWVTILLFLGVVVYYFEINFIYILLMWLLLSLLRSVIYYYRKSQFLADKNIIEKCFIGLSRALFLFIEILFFFEVFATIFLVAFHYKSNFSVIISLILFLVTMFGFSYLYKRKTISQKIDNQLSKFVFDGFILGVVFFVTTFLVFDLFVFYISFDSTTGKISESAITILVWFLPLLLPYLKEFVVTQNQFLYGSKIETTPVYDYFETCFKIIWFIYLIAIRVYYILLSKDDPFEFKLLNKDFMFKLDHPKNFPDFIIPSIIAFGISMFLFFGMQMFYEYVFVTKNINKHIIKTTKNLEDFNFIFKLNKSDNSTQFLGIVYNEKLFGIKDNSKLDNLGTEDCLIFKPFMYEKINPNLFDKARGSKKEYIDYISSSMGVKRKDFEKAISNPWKSKILSYVGNYCPND